MVRLSRIVSDNQVFQQELEKLMSMFIARGYPCDFILEISNEIKIKRLILYKPIILYGILEVDKSNSTVARCDTLIIPFNDRSQEIVNVVQEAWISVIGSNTELSRILGNKPKITYSRGKNLKNLFENNTNTDLGKYSKMSKCGACHVCRFINDGPYISISNYGKTIRCPGHCNCNSAMVVYAASCTVCQAFYIGKTIRKLKTRIIEHLSDIKRQKTTKHLTKQLLFLFQVAVYARQELNIRTTANFLLALAAWFPASRPYLRRYFCAAVQLPSDWMEVAKLYQSIADSDGKLAPLPSCLRRAMSDKFKQFDEYQLAKYNTRKQRCKHYTKKPKTNIVNANKSDAWKKMRCLKTLFRGYESSATTEAAKRAKLERKKEQDQKSNTFSLKKLIRRLHIKEPAYHVVCILGRRYPSDLSMFSKSRLPGPWDAQRAGKRMKLAEPETWERQISLRGNVKDVWEELIDHQKLPFMAMLRNLRNVIKSGISEGHHRQVLNRLMDKKSVIRSRQFPFRFLSAYKVIMELESKLGQRVTEIPPNQEILRRIFQKINLEHPVLTTRLRQHKWKRNELRAAMTIPQIYRLLQQEKRNLIEASKPLPCDKQLLQRYKNALEKAIQISSENNVPPLPGRTVILCSLDPSMNSSFFAANNLCCPWKTDGDEKQPITTAEVALLLSLMIYHACEDAQLVVYNYSSYAEITVPEGPLMGNIAHLLKTATEKLQDDQHVLPSYFLDLYARKIKVDTVILLNTRYDNNDLMKAIELYRCRLYPKMMLIEINLVKSRNISIGEEKNNVKLYGFNDQILRFVAERGASRLLDHVEKIDEIYKLPEIQGKTRKQRTLDVVSLPLLRTPKLRWQTVRVFISSTFRDMHGERDLLIRSVFPELRARAAQLFIHVQEVDLRWGITEEESRSDRQLELCLSEVSRSNILIGILGERYGYIPQKYSVPDLPQFEWLKNYPSDRSVTELEMMQFLQQSAQNKQKAFFYFRDPKFLRSVPKEWLSHFEAESVDADRKMTNLKNQVLQRGVIAFDGYPCGWGGVSSGKAFVKNLEEFGSHVLRDLWNSIQDNFSQLDNSDAEETAEETLQHAFHESQERQCYGRKKTVIAAAAKIWENKKGGVFIISGGPSEGKTVFMAALVSELMINGTTSGKKSSRSQDVFFHFTSASHTARSIENMLGRLCISMSQRLKREAAIPGNYRNLLCEFQFLLGQISQTVPRRHMIMVIDAADCLETSAGQPTSDWIPETVPKNVTLVLSVTADTSLHHSLMKRSDSVLFQLHPLEPMEKPEVIRKTLAVYGKRLDESAFNNQMRMLVTKKESRHPLYLKVATEELRTFGVFEKVTDRIREFPPTLRLLLQHVLACLETEHENADLVACALSALSISKNGLREQDLYAILNICNSLPRGTFDASWDEVMQAGKNPGRALPMARFSNLMRSLKSVMGVWTPAESPGSRLRLSNDHLRTAVEQRYLKRPGLGKQVHLLLAVYFWKIIDPDESRTFRHCDPEALPELPLHLVKSGEQKRLGKLLTNIYFLYVHHQYGLLPRLIEVYSLYFSSLPEATNAGGKVQGISPSDEEFFRDFIQRNWSVLSQNPSLFWQQVLNEPSTSPIYTQGRKVESRHKVQSQPAEEALNVYMMKWMNKPHSISKSTSKQMGLPSTPTCVCISPSGYLAAVGTSEGCLHILDTDTNQELRSVLSSCDGISDCVFLSDSYLCSTSFDGKIEIWNILDGCRILHVDAHQDRITGCAVSPDRRQLATVSWDRKLKVWSTSGGRLSVSLSHRYPINCVTFHPAGQLIATGGWDRCVRVWYLPKSACVSVFSGQKASIRALSYTPSGDFLASASLDGEVRLICTAKNFTVGSYQAHNGSVDVAKYVCNGRYLVTGGSDYKVRVWSGSLGQFRSTYSTENPSPALCVAVSPQGCSVAVGYHSENVKVFDMLSGGIISECEIPKVAVQCLAWIRGNTILASGSNDKLLKIWQVREGAATCIRVLRGHQSPLLALTPTENFLASSSDDCTVHLWSMEELTKLDSTNVSPIAVLRSHSAGVTCCAFHSERQELVTGSKDKSLAFWDLTTLSAPVLRKSLLSCHKDWITGCAWILSLVASSSNDCTIRLWDPSSGDCVREFLGHQGPVTSVNAVVDYLVSLSSDGMLRVWTVDGATVANFQAHSSRTNHCTVFRKNKVQLIVKSDAEEEGPWKPEEIMVATVSDDGTAKTWCPLLAEEICTLAGHSGPVHAAAVSDTRPFFLTVAEDKTLRMWDIPQQRDDDSALCHRSEITALAWSHCGKFLISGSETGEVIVWQFAKPVYKVQVSDYQITGIVFTNPQTVIVTSNDKKSSTWTFLYNPSKKSVCLKFNACSEPKSLVTSLAVSCTWKWVMFGDSDGGLTVHRKTRITEGFAEENFCAQIHETSAGDFWLMYHPRFPLLKSLMPKTCWEHSFDTITDITPWSSREDGRLEAWMTAAKPLGSDFRILASDSMGRLWLEECEAREEMKGSRPANNSGESCKWTKIQAHSEMITNFHVINDVIITASHDYSVKLWDSSSLKQVGMFLCQAPVSCMEGNPSCPRLIACGDILGNIYFINWDKVNFI
ncbi:telomerase protein component 1 [Protopterus annectens]|uniref:telomerase protein component 1 n=1 Tax=Protopterus annectens TaxID=7888 RepID=UPI001CF92F3E|nr:telomerase protein component 1 [Protopterus annectens]